VRNNAGDAVVVDWRTDVARAFFRASGADPIDVALRRRFGHAAGTLTSLEDERLLAGQEFRPPRADGVRAASSDAGAVDRKAHANCATFRVVG
jgi:hypothetical protein